MTMVQSRYRILVEVDVNIHAIDTLDAARYWRSMMEEGIEYFRALEVSQADFVGVQERLLAGLIRDEPTLDAFLRAEAGWVADVGALGNFEGDELADDILVPIIPELPRRHRVYYEDMIARDHFYDAAESFFAASSARPVSMSLRQIRSPHQPGPDVPANQRYRMSIDVDAEIAGIEPDAAAVHLDNVRVRYGFDPDVSLSDYVDHQRGLAAAVLANPAVLDHWLRDLVRKRIADEGAPEFRERIPEQEILGPVIERLPSTDRAYVERALAGKAFYEAFAPFLDGIGSETVSFDIVPCPEVAADV